MIHIILNSGDDAALLSHLEQTIIDHSKWGQLIEGPKRKKGYEDIIAREAALSGEAFVVREDTAPYGAGLTQAQWEGILEAEREIEAGNFLEMSWEELMEGLKRDYGI